MNNLIKRSFTLNGHRTSIALEPEFWDRLSHLAAQSGLSFPQFVARIDHERNERPLASALRVYCLLNP